jgi:hypothetical protein
MQPLEIINSYEFHRGDINELFRADNEPPPIKESISGVNPDKLWATLRRHINGTEALYGGADYRIFAAG